MDSNELLDELKRRLEIPDSHSTEQPVAAVSGDTEWYQLRSAIRDLEASAAKVGEVPANYPMHLNLLMRFLHGLLPWYTRPIREHADQTVAVARALEAVLARKQAPAHREEPTTEPSE